MTSCPFCEMIHHSCGDVECVIACAFVVGVETGQTNELETMREACCDDHRLLVGREFDRFARQTIPALN